MVDFGFIEIYTNCLSILGCKCDMFYLLIDAKAAHQIEISCCLIPDTSHIFLFKDSREPQAKPEIPFPREAG